MGQEKERVLTLDDLIIGGKTYSQYTPKMPEQLQWSGEELIYLKGDSVLSVNFDTCKKARILFTKKELGIDLNEKSKNISTITFLYPNSAIALVESEKKSYLYDYINRIKLTTFAFPDGADNKDFSRESQAYAYTSKNNLFILTNDGKTISVSENIDNDILVGYAVHQNEFGINKGTFWSTNGTLLAFYKMDQSMVDNYPLVDTSTRPVTLNNIKYPLAGKKSYHVQIGVFNPQTNQTVYLKTGTPKDKYLTNIAWSRDEKSLFVVELNRPQDTCTINKYNVSTGRLEKTLFTEVHPKYVEPQNPPLFLKTNPQYFIWQSRRNNYNHLYLYDADGNLVKPLTSGNWEVVSVIGLDEKENNLFYISTEESPLEKHIYKLNLKTGKKIKLSSEEGVHTCLLSVSGRYISDEYSSQYNPGKVSIIDSESAESKIFHIAPNPYKDIILPEIPLGTIKAADTKTDLFYRLVKPLNFDPTKKYPTIVYVYGGPHLQLITNSWMAQVRGWDIYMAQKGYLVFTVDNRGSLNRGLEFENITYHQLGVIETEDQMQGVDFLRSLPFVDQDRIGVHGWSFGGFMTLNMMLRHPSVFKVGVAGGPVTDWSYYEIMYGERYMGTPQNNADGYKKTSMLEQAKNLKGRLLLVHGDQDPVVVMQHSLQFIKSSIAAGTHPDMFIYPGHEHNVLGNDRVHLYEHITRYFDDFLK